MSSSSGVLGHCERCDCPKDRHFYAQCLGVDYNRKTKISTACNVIWARCTNRSHIESRSVAEEGLEDNERFSDQYIDCVRCPNHPAAHPDGFGNVGLSGIVLTADEAGVPYPTPRRESKLGSEQEGRRARQPTRKDKGKDPEKEKTKKGKEKEKAKEKKKETAKAKSGSASHQAKEATAESSDELTKGGSWKGKGKAVHDKTRRPAVVSKPFVGSSSDELAADADELEQEYLAMQMRQLALQERQQTTVAASSREQEAEGATEEDLIPVDIYLKQGLVCFMYSGEEIKTRPTRWMTYSADDGTPYYVFESQSLGLAFYTYTWVGVEEDEQGGSRKKDKKEKKKEKKSKS